MIKKSYQLQTGETKQIVLKKPGDYTVTLSGPGAHAEILGAFKLSGQDSLDLNVTIIHQADHTSADTLIKTVVDGQAKALINGTIIVQPKAQQTNSFLRENVLLLSPEATAQAIPNLEIEANDVKCSHAATVGPLDEMQLFYLKSRGIPEPEAIDLLTQGFLQDVTSRLNSPDAHSSKTL